MDYCVYLDAKSRTWGEIPSLQEIHPCKFKCGASNTVPYWLADGNHERVKG